MNKILLISLIALSFSAFAKKVGSRGIASKANACDGHVIWLDITSSGEVSFTTSLGNKLKVSEYAEHKALMIPILTNSYVSKVNICHHKDRQGFVDALNLGGSQDTLKR